MKRIFSSGLLLNPAIPFTEYQHVSAYYSVLGKMQSEKFRPFIIHTRDYCFSQHLHPSFGEIKQLYTVFNVFYLHCSLVYVNLSYWNQKKLDNDVKIFNRHWGMFVYSVNYS